MEELPAGWFIKVSFGNSIDCHLPQNRPRVFFVGTSSCMRRSSFQRRVLAAPRVSFPRVDTIDFLDHASKDEDFEAYLFMRENPKGVHFERWRHVNGCGKWFIAARCTMTLEVFGTYGAQTFEPPQDLKDKITAKRPGWSWRDFS